MEIKNINRTYNDDGELIVSANIDGIQFNNITHENDGVAIDASIIRKNNNWNSEQNTKYKPVVNAVDIDWNNAEVADNVNINTTGQLINWIKSIEGIQGPTGAAFTYDMFTPEQLELLIGPIGETGPQGPIGPQGPAGPQGEMGEFDFSLLDGYVSEEYVDQKIYNFGIGNFYTKDEINNAGFLTQQSLDGYVTIETYNELLERVIALENLVYN